LETSQCQGCATEKTYTGSSKTSRVSTVFQMFFVSVSSSQACKAGSAIHLAFFSDAASTQQSLPALALALHTCSWRAQVAAAAASHHPHCNRRLALLPIACKRAVLEDVNAGPACGCPVHDVTSVLLLRLLLRGGCVGADSGASPLGHAGAADVYDIALVTAVGKVERDHSGSMCVECVRMQGFCYYKCSKLHLSKDGSQVE
jgi:hypothetical protein